MTWVKVDDQFYDHPKAIKAGRDGRDLFIAGLCYCAAQLTDGFIAAESVPLIAAKAGIPNAKKAATTLVSVGFWDSVDGGYSVHEYLEYNPSGDKIKADRAAAKEHGLREGGLAAAGVAHQREVPDISRPRVVHGGGLLGLAPARPNGSRQCHGLGLVCNQAVRPGP